MRQLLTFLLIAIVKNEDVCETRKDICECTDDQMKCQGKGVGYNLSSLHDVSFEYRDIFLPHNDFGVIESLPKPADNF